MESGRHRAVSRRLLESGRRRRDFEEESVPGDRAANLRRRTKEPTAAAGGGKDALTQKRWRGANSDVAGGYGGHAEGRRGARLGNAEYCDVSDDK